MTSDRSTFTNLGQRFILTNTNNCFLRTSAPKEKLPKGYDEQGKDNALLSCSSRVKTVFSKL
jgi:hypothetical protein